MVKKCLAPYLDDRLFRLLGSLPARMTVDHAFHTDTIARAYPEFRDVPYGGKNPIASSLWRGECKVMLPYLAFKTNPLIDKVGTALRLVRASVRPQNVTDTYWLSRLSIYFTQLYGLGRR